MAKGFGPVQVSQLEKRQPVLPAERALGLRHRCGGINGPITREHALPEQRVGVDIGGVLEVTEKVALIDAFSESVGNVGHVGEFNHSFDFSSRRQSESHRGDDTEETIATDSQPKKLAIFLAAAAMNSSFGVDEREGLHILHNGLVGKAAAMSVGSQCAADAEAVGAGLFLHDTPLLRLSTLQFEQPRDQARPLGAGANLYLAFLSIKLVNTLQAVCVDEDRVGAELLPTHGVTSSHDGNRTVFGTSLMHDCLNRLNTGWLFQALHPCSIEL